MSEKTKNAKIDIPYALILEKLELDRNLWDLYREEVSRIESGGVYDIAGGANGHYDGRYQLGSSAKADASRYLKIVNPGHSAEARSVFRTDPTLQEKLFAGYTLANNRTLLTINGKYRAMAPIERIPVLGYAHNQGGNGAAKWLETGVVGKDAFGTGGDKYAKALKAALTQRAQTASKSDQFEELRNDSPSRTALLPASISSNGQIRQGDAQGGVFPSDGQRCTLPYSTTNVDSARWSFRPPSFSQAQTTPRWTRPDAIDTVVTSGSSLWGLQFFPRRNR